MPGRFVYLIISLLTALVTASLAATAKAQQAATKVSLTAAEWMVADGKPTTVNGAVTVGDDHTARLQIRLAADSWQSFAIARTTPASGGGAVVAFTFVPRPGTHEYRLLLQKDDLSVTSKPVTIRTAKGSVYLAKARHYLQTYCPTTPLTENLPATGALAGRATTKWSATEAYNDAGGITTTYSWEQGIEFRPGMRDEVLRAVSLHECAHIVQYRQMINGHEAFFATEDVADQLYEGNGREKQADCMAAAIMKTEIYLVYTRGCSAAQAKDAAALWATYGSVHQEPNLTFTLER